jgi:hypothetical protein
VVEDFAWLAQVGLDDRGVLGALQEGLAVRHDDGVDVDVGDPGGRVGLLGDLVHVALGGDARADVQELADTIRGEEPDRPADERAVGPADERGGGFDRGDRPGHVLVGQEVMRAAQPVVINPGRVRPPGFHPGEAPSRAPS